MCGRWAGGVRETGRVARFTLLVKCVRATSLLLMTATKGMRVHPVVSVRRRRCLRTTAERRLRAPTGVPPRSHGVPPEVLKPGLSRFHRFRPPFRRAFFNENLSTKVKLCVAKDARGPRYLSVSMTVLEAGHMLLHLMRAGNSALQSSHCVCR